VQCSFIVAVICMFIFTMALFPEQILSVPCDMREFENRGQCQTGVLSNTPQRFGTFVC